jgi:hypothetical protein
MNQASTGSVTPVVLGRKESHLIGFLLHHFHIAGVDLPSLAQSHVAPQCCLVHGPHIQGKTSAMDTDRVNWNCYDRPFGSELQHTPSYVVDHGTPPSTIQTHCLSPATVFFGFQGTLTGWTLGREWRGQTVFHIVALDDAFNDPRHLVKVDFIALIQRQLLVAISVEVNCVVLIGFRHQCYDRT